MTEQELFKLFQLLRKPIHWDPVPPWVKLSKRQIIQFNGVQERLNSKIAQLEAEKVQALGKIAGLSQE